MGNLVPAAFNPDAPDRERIEIMGELTKASTHDGLNSLLPRSEIQPVIDWILADMQEQEFNKALSKPNIIPFPSERVVHHDKGMQSVYLDDIQIQIMGDFYDKPGAFTFDSQRQMVEQTPLLNAIIMTRINQIKRFCTVTSKDRPGFQIALRDRAATASEADKKEMAKLEAFFKNCGWETKPRVRQRLRRDNFSNFIAKIVRDTLTMDSMPIETEFKRNRSLGIDGFYAVDGATIRLCSEEGYRGDDEIFALQVVQGRIRTAYTYEDLIYVPRNPRTDVLVGGYGLGETELLIRVVTGYLNAFSYNTKYFDNNAIPKGLLHMNGTYSEQDLSAFKRYWNAMVKGVNNAWALPVMISKDQESKATFEKFGVDVDEMMFAKWMSFLTAISCAIYGIAPDEINFESFSAAGKSSLSGDDTEEKLANSKDKGLFPLLSYLADIFTDYIVSEYGDKYIFKWTGLEEEDKKQQFEEAKLVNTVNELRTARGEDRIEEKWGDAPLNPTLVPIWQQEVFPPEEPDDFGAPGDAPSPGQAAAGEGNDFGTPDDGGAPGGDESSKDEKGSGPPGGGEDFGKSFGLPVFIIGDG